MRRKLRSFMIIALALVLLATAGFGGAYAQGSLSGNTNPAFRDFVTKVARILGKDPKDVQAAMVKARAQTLDEKVKEGKLTKAQADRIKARLAKTGNPFPRVFGRRNLVGGKISKIENSTLTVTNHKSTRTVVLTKDTKVREKGKQVPRYSLKVGERVIVGGKKGVDGRITARVVRVAPKHSGLLKEELFTNVAFYLGKTPQQLRAELKNGKSIAQVAGPDKTQQLNAMLVSAIDQRIDQAVHNGRLTQEKGDTLKSKVQDRVSKALNRVWGKGEQNASS